MREREKARKDQVRMLAGEELASLPWHLAATVREENPVKKELLRELLDWTDGTLCLVGGLGDWKPPRPPLTGDSLRDALLPGRRLTDSESIRRRFGPQVLRFEVLVSLGNHEYIARFHDSGGFVVALCRDNAPR